MHGNFDGITLSQFSNLIENNNSLIDECYKALGYTSKEEHDCRMAYRLGNVDSSYLEERGIPVPQIHEQDAQVRNLNYITMLAEYFKMDNGIVVKLKDKPYKLDHLLGGLRYTSNKIRAYAKAIIEDTEGPLVTFRMGDKDEVSNGIFTVTTKLTATAQKEILIKAIIKASGALDKTLPSEVTKHPEFIPILAIKDKEAYINTLELAEERGITYSELMLENGYKIYDYADIYQYAKCIPTAILNTVYIMTDDSTVDDPYPIVIDADELELTLQTLAVGGGECNT